MGPTEQYDDTPTRGLRPRRTIGQRGHALGAGALALLLSATLAACGGSDSDTDTTTTAAAQATATATEPVTEDSGIAGKSGAEILTAATDTAKAASSVLLTGEIEEVRLDLQLVRGVGASGSIAQDGNDFDLIAIDDKVYIRGSDAFYRQLGGEAVVQLLRGKWLQVDADDRQFASFAQLTDMETLLDEALRPEGETITKGEIETVEGQEAIGLTTERERGTLFVATTGDPYPLQIVGSEDRPGTITFGEWNADVELEAPADAIDVDELAAQTS